MCQLRTNYRFGVPSASDVTTLLNAAIEQLGIETEPLLLNGSVAVTVANTNIITLPADIFRIRSMTYSTGLRGTIGVSEYEMVQLPVDEFIENSDYNVASAVGGIPTVYTIIQDSAAAVALGATPTGGQMTMQFYPLASSGYINYFYSARPTLWSAGDGTTTTNVDPAFQEPAILWTCARMCEARQNMNQARVFDEQFKAKLDSVHYLVKRRARKSGSNLVRDVSEGESVTPFWMS